MPPTQRAEDTATEAQDSEGHRHDRRMSLLARNLALPHSVVTWWLLELELERRAAEGGRA